MNFVFDLDDTICETDEFSEYYINNFIKENSLPIKQIATITRYAESKFDWDDDTALSWYKKFGDEMMLNFPCKTNSIELINNLYDAGHQIIIATARHTDWHTNPVEITKQWLENNNIKYNKIYLGRIDKEKICEETNADIFVDDDIKMTENVNKHYNNPNKKVFLMTTLFNKNLESTEGIIRIDNFAQLFEELKLLEII